MDNDGNEGVDEGFPDTTPGGPKDCMDNNYDADGDSPSGGDPQRGGNAEDTNDDSWWVVGGSWHHDMFPDSHENFAGTRRDVACEPRATLLTWTPSTQSPMAKPTSTTS